MWPFFVRCKRLQGGFFGNIPFEGAVFSFLYALEYIFIKNYKKMV